MAALIFLAFLGAASWVIYTQQKKARSLSYQLKQEGIYLAGTENFSIKKSSPDYFYAQSQDELIKIEITKEPTKETSLEHIQKETALLKSFFEPQLPPYPEFLTQESSCADKYKPQEKESLYGKYFTMYAGERFGYGVCVDNLITYRASLGYFYCNNTKNFIKIQYFINKDLSPEKLDALNNSFKCTY